MSPSVQDQKHIACSRCRDRKVKCDGGRPTCKRCQHHNQSCQYIKGKKQQVKNEWVQHMSTFSSHPVKAIVSTASLSHSVQPSYPGGSNGDAEGLGDRLSPSYSSVRSPYFIDNAQTTRTDTSNTEGSFNSFANINESTASVSSSSSFPANTDMWDPSLFPSFDCSLVYDDTNYTSNMVHTEPRTLHTMNNLNQRSQHAPGLASGACGNPPETTFSESTHQPTPHYTYPNVTPQWTQQNHQFFSTPSPSKNWKY